MHVASLHIHPVKSTRAHEVSTLHLDAEGARYDRQWLVVDAAGKFLSIRDNPRMILVSAHVRDNVLHLSASGRAVCLVQLDAGAGSAQRITVVQSQVTVVDVSVEASRWLSEVLGQTVRLVRKADGAIRHPGFGIPPIYQLGFADLGQLLVTTTGSLDDLNRRLDAAVSMERFRPNVVVDGAPPWAEDRWKRIRIGATELRLVAPDVRCAVVNVDPETAQRSAEPLRTLSKFRRRTEPVPGVYFGLYFYRRAREPAEIHRGDTVEVLETTGAPTAPGAGR